MKKVSVILLIVGFALTFVVVESQQEEEPYVFNKSEITEKQLEEKLTEILQVRNPSRKIRVEIHEGE